MPTHGRIILCYARACQHVLRYPSHGKMFLVKIFSKTCEVPRNFSVCQSVLGYANMCEENQGNKKKNQVKMQGNEHIRGLISQEFILSKRGMLSTLILCFNTCQVPMCAKCSCMLMHAKVLRGMLGTIRHANTW